MTSRLWYLYCPSSVADPGIRCLFDPWIRDPGWVKDQDPDPGSGYGMNIPDHISESLETIFCVKILKFYSSDADPGIFLTLDPGSWIRDSGMEKIRIVDLG
jgi:hypothetical protein